jgi:hypothetical protein
MVDTARLRTRFRLPSRFTRLFGDTFLALVWSIAAIASGLGFIWSHRYGEGASLVALGAIMTFLSLRPTTVIAGADGVEIRWLGTSRFIPYAELAQIEKHYKYKLQTQVSGAKVETSRGVLILHERGDTYLICDDDVARDLIAAVEDGLAKHRRAAAADLNTIRRGRLTVADWMASLRGLLSQQDGYRGRATTSDELWSALENPKTDPSDRAAAALALRAHLGEEARPRLRVAIESCASPRLRVALEAIDQGDDATTTESLDELTEPETGAR